MNKPTIIGGGDGGGQTPLKPTTIGSGSAPAQKLPTVIGSTPVQPVVPVVVRVTQPSAMPGVRRERIPVTREDLIVKHRLSDAVLNEALKIIETTNQDSFTLNQAVLWGQSLQEKFGVLVSDSLTLAQSEVVATVSGYLNRMMELLEEIKLEKVFEKGAGLLTGVLRKSSKEIDTVEELDEALREIDQLSGHMRGRIDELLQLRERIESNSKQIEALCDSVEASIAAAITIADYFENLSKKDFSERLQERAGSLTVTLGQIRSNGSMRNLQIEQPMRLTSLIQNVVFTTLPSWTMSVASLKVAFQGNQKPNQTEVGEVSRVLKTIVGKFTV